MTLSEIIARVRGHGATLTVDGDDLVVDYTGERPPAPLYAALREHKAEILEHLRVEALNREAVQPVVREIDAQRPPDVSDNLWRVALAGLTAFLADGLGDEAEAAGWPHDQLYQVPPLWSRVDLTGVALLIGGNRVVSIGSDEILIQTTSGSQQRFTRKRPEDEARIVAWINARLITWEPTHCLHCRKPIVVGDKFVTIAAGGVVSRFHARCEGEWRREQIAAARKALGLEP
jgi:hypothetical protein